MTNYKFKHESVLNYRLQIEDAIKREFGALQKALAKEETKLIEAKELYIVKSEEMHSKDLLSPNDLEIYRGYLKFLRIQKAACTENIDSIQTDIQKKREELVAASRDKKILEVIKDKGRIEYIKDEAKEEQAINDEFNINKFTKYSGE